MQDCVKVMIVVMLFVPELNCIICSLMPALNVVNLGGQAPREVWESYWFKGACTESLVTRVCPF